MGMPILRNIRERATPANGIQGLARGSGLFISARLKPATEAKNIASKRRLEAASGTTKSTNS
jgi:hypothetical protein